MFFRGSYTKLKSRTYKLMAEMLDLKQPLSKFIGEHKKQNHQRTPNTIEVTRGICRCFENMGYAPLVEFRLPNKRRVDIIGLGPSGDFIIVEVKVSVADYKGDQKWPDYLAYCDRFYFGVPPDFPNEILTPNFGLITADKFGGVICREAPTNQMTTKRRKYQQIKFALTAAHRLQRLIDPEI